MPLPHTDYRTTERQNTCFYYIIDDEGGKYVCLLCHQRHRDEKFVYLQHHQQTLINLMADCKWFNTFSGGLYEGINVLNLCCISSVLQ